MSPARGDSPVRLPRVPVLASADRPVRFQLSVEISTIYKRGDRTRKVHHLIYLPDLDAVARFNTALGRIGNLGSDVQNVPVNTGVPVTGETDDVGGTYAACDGIRTGARTSRRAGRPVAAQRLGPDVAIDRRIHGCLAGAGGTQIRPQTGRS